MSRVFPEGQGPQGGPAPESHGNFGHSLHSDDADKFIAFVEKCGCAPTGEEGSPGFSAPAPPSTDQIRAAGAAVGLSADTITLVLQLVQQFGPTILSTFSTLLASLKRTTAVAK